MGAITARLSPQLLGRAQGHLLRTCGAIAPIVMAIVCGGRLAADPLPPFQLPGGAELNPAWVSTISRACQDVDSSIDPDELLIRALVPGVAGNDSERGPAPHSATVSRIDADAKTAVASWTTTTGYDGDFRLAFRLVWRETPQSAAFLQAIYVCLYTSVSPTEPIYVGFTDYWVQSRGLLTGDAPGLNNFYGQPRYYSDRDARFRGLKFLPFSGAATVTFMRGREGVISVVLDGIEGCAPGQSPNTPLTLFSWPCRAAVTRVELVATNPGYRGGVYGGHSQFGWVGVQLLEIAAGETGAGTQAR